MHTSKPGIVALVTVVCSMLNGERDLARAFSKHAEVLAAWPSPWRGLSGIGGLVRSIWDQTMSRICVFAASKMELRPVVDLSRSNGSPGSAVPGATLRVGPNDLMPIVAGMGPQLARKRAAEALSAWGDRDGSGGVSGARPDAILVIGLCGGLTQSLPQSRLVVYTKCLSSAEDRPLDCDPAITSRLAQVLGSGGVTCQRVIGITSPRIAVTRADRLALAGFGAGVVDMESYELLSAAARASVPAAVLRVVSDSVDSDLPDFNEALNADGALDGRKALRVALGSPVLTFRLLAQNKRAMRELAAALAIVLPADLTG
jgi:hypothetical protein